MSFRPTAPALPVFSEESLMVYVADAIAAVPERVHSFDDRSTGLKGVIVIHSTRMGPAAGGCRFHAYASDHDRSMDAVRLAEGMSYKNALAGLPLGGGKAVLQMPAGPIDRVALFRAFGREVAELRGDYVTAEDVGTSVADMGHVRTATTHVA
ncbi:MAG: amino acid dehydrogenase, partial [Bradyrhizobium sp.]|nr:amino acid dehydrogenase [Bradyrhizobium sp.]